MEHNRANSGVVAVLQGKQRELELLKFLKNDNAEVVVIASVEGIT